MLFIPFFLYIYIYICTSLRLHPVCRLYPDEDYREVVTNAALSVGISKGPTCLILEYAKQESDLGCQTMTNSIPFRRRDAFVLPTEGGVIIISGGQIRIVTPLSRGFICSVGIAIKRAYTSTGTLVLLTTQKEWLCLDLGDIEKLNQQLRKIGCDLCQVETSINALTKRLLCTEVTSLCEIDSIRNQVALLKEGESKMVLEKRIQEQKLRTAKQPVKIKLSIPSDVSLDNIIELFVIGQILVMVNITHIGRGRSKLLITVFCRTTGRLAINYVETDIDVHSVLCCTQTSETTIMVGVHGAMRTTLLSNGALANGTIILAYEVGRSVLNRTGCRFLDVIYTGVDIVSYGSYVIIAVKGVAAYTLLLWLKPKTLEIPAGIFRPDVLPGFTLFMRVMDDCLVIGLPEFIYVYLPSHVVLDRIGYTNQSPDIQGPVFVRKIQIPAHSGHVMLAVTTDQMGLLLVIGGAIDRTNRTRDLTELVHIQPRMQRRQNPALKRPSPNPQNAAVSQPKKARITLTGASED